MELRKLPPRGLLAPLIVAGLVACGAWTLQWGLGVSSADESQRVVVPALASNPLVSDSETANMFPVRIHEDGYLTSSTGEPLLLQGEAAWSAIAQLSVEEASAYAASRHLLGFNAVLVNLVEHEFSEDPPANVNGDRPFLPGAPFVAYNEIYFRHADTIIKTFFDENILVFLFPSYLGYEGGDEGWFQELDALSPATCADYGSFVGRRYRMYANIVWVAGGDFGPPPGGGGEACTRAIFDAIREADPDALITGHWSPESTSLSQANLRDLVQIDGVYTYGDVASACGEADGRNGVMPTFLLETAYENEWDASSRDLRAAVYSSYSSCRSGFIGGNRPIWFFGDGWEQELRSPATLQHAIAASALRRTSWWRLRADSSIVSVSGNDESPRLTTLYASDGESFTYVAESPSPDGTLVFDVGRLGGSVRVTFVDPVSGEEVDGGQLVATELTAVAVPEKNAGGDRDWVILTSGVDSSTLSGDCGHADRTE